MTIHNPDSLPEGVIDKAIQLMQSENPNRTILGITVKATDKKDVYSIVPTFKIIPFERVRRITGYLTGNTDTWNTAKQAELRDRVKHVGGRP